MQGETKAHLKDHKRVHQQKTLHCSQCGFKAQFKSDLARHNIIHSGERPFACTQKGCAYSSSGAWGAWNLVVHQLGHSNLKPFKCNLCGKCFRRSSHLNCHIRSHTGEKPYKCLFKDCDYSFTQAGALQKHFRRHTGEKPYRCSYEACKYSFTQSSNLKRHMMTHTDRQAYMCSFKNCKYSSIHAIDLKYHTNRIHIRNKRHACQSCEYRAETAVEVKKHIIKRHNNASQTFISLPRLNSSSSSSLIEIESAKIVSHSKLFKGLKVDEDPKIFVRTFVRLTRLKSNCCSKKDIPATSTRNLEASRDPIHKTKSRPGNTSLSPVKDPKLRIPVVVVLERLQVNYDSDDDYVGDSLRAKDDLTIPTVPNCTKSNTEPQAGLKPKKKDYLYTCKICDYETTKFKKYKSHLQSHREQRQFICPLCDFVCFRKRLLKSHFRSHDNDSSASDSDRYNDTQSHDCGVSIKSQEALFNNTSVSVNTNCFGSQSSKNKEIEIQQNTMGRILHSVTTTVQLQEIRTKRKQSLTTPKRATQAEKKIVSQSAESKHVLFSCIFCNKTFKKEMKLLNHLRYHTGEPTPPHLHY